MNISKNNPIRILHLEDDPNDAELIGATLVADGLSCDITCVDNKDFFINKLSSGHYDLILSDYSLPQFDGLSALAIARKHNPDIPFILLSGMFGEEMATDSIKAGATDYVLKQRLARLVPSVKRALREMDEKNQRLRAEEALRESEEKYRNLVDNLDIGVSLFSPDGNIITCNHQISKWFPDIDIKDPLKTNPAYQVFSSSYQLHKCIENPPGARVMADGGKHEYVRELLIGDNIRFFRMMATPVRDSKGSITGIIEIMEDVTDKINTEKEKKELEERLQQAQKMEAIGTLAGGIAHDLNNILSPIMIYTDMVMMDMLPGSIQESCLKEIFKATERARDLIRQILTFSHQKQKEIKPVVVGDIVKEALKLLRPSTPSTIEIRFSNDSDSDNIFADPTQIHQIIINLCTNAVYAMKEKGGLIEIFLSTVIIDNDSSVKCNNLKPGHYKKLCIRDNGTGMDQNLQKRIFEPYFTTKKIGEGTGLGLAVIHGIIKSYNGEITVESEPGKGTTFCVYLPRTKDVLPSTLPDNNAFQKGSGRLLLVDDEKTIVDSMRISLERLGYTVTATTDSRECLTLFSQDPGKFDLVITDMTMPGLTGKDLIAQLQSLRPDIPILLCTGYNEIIDATIARKIGVAAYMQKPLSVHEIATKIHEIIENRQPE
ncbi:MAG: response regulator [Chitinispirillaceae bacterium]|nr:response regulator [Chitinispirillaceae bacterium]